MADHAGGRCVVCQRALRRGAPVVRCRRCAGGAHRMCSGLRRRRREEIDDMWRCPGCDEADEISQIQRNSPNRPVVRSENLHCPECRGKLRNAGAPLVCHSCNRRYHLKCAKETRKALEVRRKGNTWKYHQCIDHDTSNPVGCKAPGGRRVGGGASGKKNSIYCSGIVTTLPQRWTSCNS